MTVRYRCSSPASSGKSPIWPQTPLWEGSSHPGQRWPTSTRSTNWRARARARVLVSGEWQESGSAWSDQAGLLLLLPGALLVAARGALAASCHAGAHAHADHERLAGRPGPATTSFARRPRGTHPQPLIYSQHCGDRHDESRRFASGDARALLPPRVRDLLHQLGRFGEVPEPSPRPASVGRYRRLARRSSEQPRRAAIRHRSHHPTKSPVRRRLLASGSMAVRSR